MRRILRKLFARQGNKGPDTTSGGEEKEEEHEELVARSGGEEVEPVARAASPEVDSDPAHQRETLVEDGGLDILQTAPMEPLPDDPLPTMSATLSGRSAPDVERESSIDAACYSHVGAVRRRNEDAYFSFTSSAGGFDPLPEFGLFVVADGMGGHFDGHLASRIVSRTVGRHVLEELYRPLLLRNKPSTVRPIQEVMEEAVVRANEAIANPEPDREMGTTLTAALVFGKRLFLAHVGDSRAYLSQDGQLQLLSTDHSLVQALQDSGQLTAEEAAVHPNRNLLYRALIGEPLEQIETYTQALTGCSRLLLCSDGLWDLVPDKVIQETLESELPLQDKATRLVKEALEGGGHDNITVIVADLCLR